MNKKDYEFLKQTIINNPALKDRVFSATVTE
jgi:hypothetical protein